MALASAGAVECEWMGLTYCPTGSLTVSPGIKPCLVATGHIRFTQTAVGHGLRRSQLL